MLRRPMRSTINPNSRRREDRREEDIAVHLSGAFERQAVRVLEVFDGKRAAERKDDGVEGDAETDDVPVGAIEAPQIRPDDLIGSPATGSSAYAVRRWRSNSPVDDRADNEITREADRDQSGCSPARCVGTAAHDGDRSAAYEPARAMLRFMPEREAQLPAVEPVSKRRGDRDDHRLRAQAEEESSSGHHGNVPATAVNSAREADRGEHQRRCARAESDRRGCRQSGPSQCSERCRWR